ncbi:Uncharacterized protein TCM_005043 [Theobroma cacao]|uniref:Secreted protein n=1 Tax=Theobroma cacao TaxID=3641 RepID=A0A061DS94_THECC|nr:Uncharacterized protein TCM_005043 [Theobroma cacao]
MFQQLGPLRQIARSYRYLLQALLLLLVLVLSPTLASRGKEKGRDDAKVIGNTSPPRYSRTLPLITCRGRPHPQSPTLSPTFCNAILLSPPSDFPTHVS